MDKDVENKIGKFQNKKVLFTATVVKTHINVFHLPYLKWFKEQGYEVHVAAKNDFVNEPCIIPYCDKFYDINFARFPFSIANIKAYKQLKKIITENNYDIIHCHTPVAGVLTRLAARNSKNTTVIYTAHGFHFFKGAPLLNWLIYYPVERFCARFTDKLITINKEDYERAQYFKLRKNGKVYYISGVGIDIEKIKNTNVNVQHKKKELGIPENVPVILSVGELNKNKNHIVVLNALSKLQDRRFIYLICGRGGLKEYLEEKIKELDLENKVKLLEYRNDIKEILKIVNLFIFPSKREGLPVSLIEAMAAGLPSLASDVRGNRDLLNKEDLFELDDLDTLVKLIGKQLANIENKKFSKVKYENIEQYSLQNVLKQMADIYEENINVK